jgi:hypothetical protein
MRCMGHVRLGPIPKSQKWQTVVALFTAQAPIEPLQQATLQPSVSIVAARALDAAQIGLDKALDDPGLAYTFYLLTQLVLTSRQQDWESNLRPFNVQITPDAGLFDLTAEVHAAIDAYLLQRNAQTDVSELAQRSAGGALTTLVGPRSVTLFGSGRDELQQAVRAFSTPSGFAELSQRFFGNFVAQYLNFHLSRITASHVGTDSLSSVGDITRFNEALYLHCYQSARIIHDFSREWFSKTEYVEGITLDNSAGFMAIAIKKIQAELRLQGTEL